jgi:hypothetical protein
MLDAETKTMSLKGRLLFDFSKAARRAVQDYPDELAETIFIDGDTKQVVADTFTDHRQKKLSTMTSEGLMKLLRNDLFGDALAFAWGSPHRERGMMYRRPSQEDNPFNVGHGSEAAEMIFDHELGHILVPGGMRGTEKDAYATLASECRADAFAAIRRLQRAGAAADDLAGYCSATCYGYFTGTEDHATAPVVDRIRIDGQAGKFARLSPAETLATAEYYATNYNPSPESWAEVARVYAPVLKTRFEEKALDGYAIAETMLKLPVDSLAFRMGAGALDHAFRKQPEVFADPDSGWDGLRAKLKARIDASGGPQAEILQGKIFSDAAVPSAEKPTPVRKAPRAPK